MRGRFFVCLSGGYLHSSPLPTLNPTPPLLWIGAKSSLWRTQNWRLSLPLSLSLSLILLLGGGGKRMWRGKKEGAYLKPIPL